MFKKDSFIKKDGIFYIGVLNEIRKSSNPLQPILEAITNSLEAINLRESKNDNGTITLKLMSKRTLHGDLEFNHIIIEDDGVGFNDENFERALTYKDTRKGFNNKGSGRIQLVHFFNTSEYKSIFFDKDKFRSRTFNLSKSEPYLKENSLVFYKDTVDVEDTAPRTNLILKDLLEGSENYYNSLDADVLKKSLVARYMLYFCSHREKMPNIIIQHYVGSSLLKEEKIESSDIPQFDKEDEFPLFYSALSTDAKSIVETSNKELFKIRAFKIDKDILDKNSIKLTSKNEIVDNVKIPLACIQPEEHIDGSRYLFLLSGNYLDSRDSDTRGEFKIPTIDDFKKQNDVFSSEEILLEDIQKAANNKVLSMYGDGGLATAAKIDVAYGLGIAIDGSGNLYIPDYNHNTIRVVGTKCPANAGPDLNDVQTCTSWAVQIGTPSVPNMVYSWSPATRLNNASNSQPICSYTNSYTLATVYTLSVSYSLCTTNTSSMTVTAVPLACPYCCKLAAGISNESKSNWSFTIYPNPSNGQITLSLIDKASYINIMDMQGRLVYSEKNIDAGELKLDISNYNSGIYFIVAKIGDSIENQKIIVE